VPARLTNGHEAPAVQTAAALGAYGIPIDLVGGYEPPELAHELGKLRKRGPEAARAEALHA
jgi:hypothetical protein